LHAVVLTGTLLALLALPCALVLVRSSGEAPTRWAGLRRAGIGGEACAGAGVGRPAPAWSGDRAERLVRRAWSRRNRADRRALGRLDRTINQPFFVDRLPAQRRLPPVEQIAAELRRLNRQRCHGPGTESERWSAAVVAAYDNWLLAACRRLDISEQLTMLAGIDREIERVRVEGQLEIAGLVLR